MNATITTNPLRIKLLAALAGVGLLNGCMAEPEEITEDTEDTEVTAAGSNVVISWAGTAYDAIVRPVEEATTLRSLGPSMMLMAQVQLAVYDTMATITREYYPFSYQGSAYDVDRSAAVATAAYRILRTRVPGRGVFLDTAYASTMDAIRAGGKKTRGTALGEAVASHYLTLRANDNIDATYAWTQPTPAAGVFEPTVAGAQPVDYKMVFVPPFTFSNAQSASFFPPAPPALTSSQYATGWDETRRLGGANSTTRTEAQKQLALWSGENAFRWSARNLVALATAKRLDTMQSARFFAFTITSLADTIQSGMAAKYHYNYWRPIHSIPRADLDPNSATTADTTWTPLLNVNHPEYPAGHGFTGAGALVESVRAFFRTDAVSWTLDTVGVTGLTQTTRSYTSLTALARDIMDARVYAGLHYRFSVEAGRVQGDRIVDHVNANHFRHR
jgi:PAP2 superfamily